ncbi:uncharacterized protein HKW66_Vig0201570 [Vigna angularis]|uniref:Beta-1,3-N-Acetylglucosaminyltransferase family protein n=1 Tax=Phaseolus angularis TaxID=3914 RepID=A0A8T0JR98_PHAAN|nr:uncharacterized protein HKW66_Vig0201570 [Vigna angularis]
MEKIFVSFLLFVLVSQGYSQCSLSDIVINQSPTGRKVHGKTEWTVTITNRCACVQKNVKLNCNGFQTIEAVEASFLKVSGDVCLVSDGQPLFSGATMFNYAWDTQFSFKPISSTIAC